MKTKKQIEEKIKSILKDYENVVSSLRGVYDYESKEYYTDQLRENKK